MTAVKAQVGVLKQHEGRGSHLVNFCGDPETLDLVHAGYQGRVVEGLHSAFQRRKRRCRLRSGGQRPDALRGLLAVASPRRKVKSALSRKELC